MFSVWGKAIDISMGGEGAGQRKWKPKSCGCIRRRIGGRPHVVTTASCKHLVTKENAAEQLRSSVRGNTILNPLWPIGTPKGISQASTSHHESDALTRQQGMPVSRLNSRPGQPALLPQASDTASRRPNLVAN